MIQKKRQDFRLHGSNKIMDCFFSQNLGQKVRRYKQIWQLRTIGLLSIRLLGLRLAYFAIELDELL